LWLVKIFTFSYNIPCSELYDCGQTLKPCKLFHRIKVGSGVTPALLDLCNTTNRMHTTWLYLRCIFKMRNKPGHNPFLLWAVFSVEVPSWGTATLFRERQSWDTINNTQPGRWWIEVVDVTRQIMMWEIIFRF
jgi:hypothetical protein